MKKFEMTDEVKAINGSRVSRIRALKSFGDVKAGEQGGWIEQESNLAQSGEAWVYDEAVVSGEAVVFDQAKVYDRARVFGWAQVYDQAQVRNHAIVSGGARVYGHALVFGHASVFLNTKVGGYTILHDNVQISTAAQMYMPLCGGYTEESEYLMELAGRQVYRPCGSTTCGCKY